jgi:SAM-dependent methyltransferase
VKAYEMAGFDMHGLEPSRSFHRAAIEGMRMDPVKYRCMAVEHADYPEASFDFINIDAVLEHVLDPDVVIRRALRWLRPGGALHIEVPSSRWLMSALINAYYRLRGADYVTNLSPMHEPYHIYEFDRRCFELHGDRAGYRIVHYRPIIGRTMLATWLDPIMQPLMRWTDRGMEFDVWLMRSDRERPDASVLS